MKIRRCADEESCGHKLPSGARPNMKYCPTGCPECVAIGRLKAKCGSRVSERNRKRRQAAAAKAEKLALETGRVPGLMTREEAADGRTSARRGPGYEEFFVRAGWGPKIAAHDKGESGGMSIVEVATASGQSEANVSRWYAAWREDRLIERQFEAWSRSPEIEALLQPTAEAFAAWRAKYFTDPFGEAYITPAVQRKWIRAILVAIMRGRRQVILTPPRHGKTELLIHFCIWLICRNPNIRILWIGPNELIAKQSGQSVIDQLQNNKQLIEDMLGPGTWRPAGRSGASWTATKATVATRTLTGIKSPSIACIGKGGELVSRDADFIVADDIVSLEDASSPTARDQLDQWFVVDLSSRKQNHTGLVAIGSRRGHKDLWGTLVKNPGWASIVEHAHDPECDLPVHGPVPVEEHDTCFVCPPVDLEQEDVPEECDHVKCDICAAHVDCMLIPELASFHFLQNQRTSAQNETYFEMVYQNITRSEGSDWAVSGEELKAVRNRERRLGEALNGERIEQGKHHGLRLVGGLDPATAGFQAAMLWGYEPSSRKRVMVELDNRRAGGLQGARDIIKDWYVRFGLRTWVIESVGYQEAILQDREIVDFCSAHGILLMPHITDRWNKYDRTFGVIAQFQLIKQGVIDTPCGDEASLNKVRVWEQQVTDFEPEDGNKKSKRATDVVMAGWFPETQIRYWQVEMVTEVQTMHDEIFTGSYGDDFESAFASAVA